MNEFAAKKLGEAWAFCDVGQTIVSRGGSAFVEAFGEESANWFTHELGKYAGILESAGRDNEVTEKKAEATVTKLTEMMEHYIGDEWDNPVEILEWMSFFLGAAAAHWSVVQGAAEKLEDKNLASSAQEAADMFSQLLPKVQEQLSAYAVQRTEKEG